MWFDYYCDHCKNAFDLNVPSSERDNQRCPWCGHWPKRQQEFRSKTIAIPKAFQTSKELVMGAPGSKERDQFEKDIRSGATVPVGSRWV